MKRIVALALALALLALSGSALAAGGRLSTTRSFTAALDAEGITYDPPETVEDGVEYLALNYTDDGVSYDIAIYFDPELNCTAFVVYDLAAFQPGSRSAVLEVCDTFNRDTPFVRLYTETDNTVTAYMEVTYNDPNCGRFVYDALLSGIVYFNEAADDLAAWRTGMPSGSFSGGATSAGTNSARGTSAGTADELIGTWTSTDLGSLIGSVAGAFTDMDFLGDMLSGTATLTFRADGTYTLTIQASVLFGFASESQSEHGTWSVSGGTLSLRTDGSGSTIAGSADLQYSVSNGRLTLRDSSGMSLVFTR